jgi:hypothetical protein
MTLKKIMSFSLDEELAEAIRKKYPSNMSYFINKILREQVLDEKN